MSAVVQRLAPGFVVTVDGVPFPKALPGKLCIFRGIRAAQRFARALDANDMQACHELIARYGEWYERLRLSEAVPA